MTVPFVMFSAYSTPFEFQHTLKLAAPTRLFVSQTLLPLALSSGLPGDRIYILEGHVQGRPSYGDLVARAQSNGLPRLPIQPAQTDTLAYLVFSSGTSGLPKGASFRTCHRRGLTRTIDPTAVMISHGNLIDAVSQVSVMTAEALKVNPVRISLSNPLTLSSALRKASGMERPGWHERVFQCPPDTSYLWPPHHYV